MPGIVLMWTLCVVFCVAKGGLNSTSSMIFVDLHCFFSTLMSLFNHQLMLFGLNNLVDPIKQKCLYHVPIDMAMN